MLNLFSGLSKQAGSDLQGLDLSKLLSGEGLVPNASDIELVNRVMEASLSKARRGLEDFTAQGNAALDESLAARGIQGSSIESVQRALVQRDAGRQYANIADSARGDAANMLFNVPFQRAGMQLSANQALFQRLGLGQSVLNQGLQERLAQTTTTQSQSGLPLDQLAQLGMTAAGVATGNPFLIAAGTGAPISLNNNKSKKQPEKD